MPDPQPRKSETLACTKHQRFVPSCVWCRSATQSLRACTKKWIPAWLDEAARKGY